MAIDKTIFGLRFGANDELSPAQEDLRIFLQSTKDKNGKTLHGEDLTTYNEMLANLQAFDHNRKRGIIAGNLERKVFFEALEHVSFFKPAFKSAVEQYKYHLHTLNSIDFKKPTNFIKSAEEEIGRLNPKKKDDSAKLARLKVMIHERKRSIELLKIRWDSLIKELKHIALYVSENLAKIEKLCAVSVGILTNPQTALNEENRIIDDIKTLFKERLKESLHRGQVTKQDLEDVKRTVEILSREIPEVVRDDLDALASFYQSIYNHARDSVHALKSLMTKFENNEVKNLEDNGKLFLKVEGVLVAAVSECRFEIEIKDPKSQTAYGDILEDRRKEMFDRILDILFRERRIWIDRRQLADRRKFNDPKYRGPERRSGKDRRSGKRRDGF
jgi:hypothetical protein